MSGNDQIYIHRDEIQTTVDKIMLDWGDRDGYSRSQIEQATWTFLQAAVESLVESLDWYVVHSQGASLFNAHSRFDQALGDPVNPDHEVA